MSETTKRLAPLCGLGGLLMLLALAVPVQASPSIQSSVCDRYVDNHASSDGDGSWTRPWRVITDHLDDLVPGDTMCVRGDVSGSGRVYGVNELYVDSEGGTVRDGVPGSPVTVRSYPGEKVILRNVGGDSLIYFRGADYWVFEGFVMDNNGRRENAVRFKYGANHNILSNNEIHNGRSNGVALYEGPNIGNVIESNHIHDFDAGDRDAVGIILHPGSDDTIIRDNVIHDCSGDGVHIYAVNDTPISEYSQGVQIEGNVLYRGTLQRSEDGIDIKGADGLVVAGNELYGYYSDDDWSGEGRAFVVQKGSRNILFESNVVHNTSFGINCHGEGGKHPANITLRNNLFYNMQGLYVILFCDTYGAVAYHNTMVNVDGHSFFIGCTGIHGGDIRNNLVYNSREAKIGDGVPFEDVTVGYNGWFDAESEFAASTDIVGSGNPGLLYMGAGEYRLALSSPARDAGVDVGVTADFEGDARPFGIRPDIGADEYTPYVYLRATPGDRAVHLKWTDPDDPGLASYVITYTYGTGGSDASQGPSPILDLPTTTRVYSLAGVTNYAFYTVTVAARDGSDADLFVSNSVRVMPTDIFAYLPAAMKKGP